MEKLIAMIREEKWKLNFRDNYGGQTSTIANAHDTILMEACVEQPPKGEKGHSRRGDITTIVSQLPSYETESQNPSRTSTVTHSHATIRVFNNSVFARIEWVNREYTKVLCKNNEVCHLIVEANAKCPHCLLYWCRAWTAKGVILKDEVLQFSCYGWRELSCTCC